MLKEEIEKIAKEAAKEAFKLYKDVEEFFVTMDKQVFAKFNDANNHAHDLEDKTVTSVKKVDVTTKK